MKRWMVVSMIACLAWIAMPINGWAAVTITQQTYFFAMEVTRDVTASTFVIGDFGPTRPLRPPLSRTIAANDPDTNHLNRQEEIVFPFRSTWSPQ